jgi:hypothetical protein
VRLTRCLMLLAFPLAGGIAPAAAEAQRRTESEAFTWSGRVPDGRWIMIRNMNGTVEVIPSTSDRVEVSAARLTRRGDPEYVRFEVKKYGAGDQDVLVCALWGNNANCDESGYRSRNDGRHGNEVVVNFTVRVPRGVKVAAYSTNGEVRVRDMTAEVDASTTNGSVSVATSSGPVNASTTNGSVRVIMGAFDIRQDMTFETTNGSVIVSFADDLNAEVDLRTVNGRFLSDLPVTISGRIDPRRLRATLGKGGPRIRLATVNGNVELRKR